MALRQNLLVLAEYNKWATENIQKWHNTYMKTDESFYTKRLSLPFNDVQCTLAHIWANEQFWMARINNSDIIQIKPTNETISYSDLCGYWTTGNPNDGKFSDIFKKINTGNKYGNLNELIFNALYESHNDVIQYLQNIDNTTLETESIHYVTTDGNKHSNLIHVIIAHIVNHSTHHRGQISGFVKSFRPNSKSILLDLPDYIAHKRSKL